jgi:hypothetical protein
LKYSNQEHLQGIKTLEDVFYITFWGKSSIYFTKPKLKLLMTEQNED